MARRKVSHKQKSAPPAPARVSTSLTVAADGRFLANAAKYARGATLAAFQGIGGVQRLTEVADEDPKWFFKNLFAKLVQPERQVVAEADDDVEDLLKKLDRRVLDVEGAVIEADDDGQD